MPAVTPARRRAPPIRRRRNPSWPHGQARPRRRRATGNSASGTSAGRPGRADQRRRLRLSETVEGGDVDPGQPRRHPPGPAPPAPTSSNCAIRVMVDGRGSEAGSVGTQRFGRGDRVASTAAGLVRRLGVLVGPIGVGDDARRRPGRRPWPPCNSAVLMAIAKSALPCEVEVAEHAAVQPATRLLDLLDELHRSDLRRAGQGARPGSRR